MRVIWHADAHQELIDAAEFYDTRLQSLGADFLDAVDDVIEWLSVSPGDFPIVEGDVRRCRVARFPYCVYFRRLGDAIQVLVVMHHYRHPDYWKSRQ
jgi:plasmid stabilization system protein ParE